MSSELKSTAQIIRDMQGRSVPSPAQKRIMDTAFAAIDSWMNGEIDLAECETYLGDGWLRSKIAQATPIDSEDFKKLMIVLDALVASRAMRSGDVMTQHGYLTASEVADHYGRYLEEIDPSSGELRFVLQFPVKLPKDGSAPIYRPLGKRDAEIIPEPSRYADAWFESAADEPAIP